MRAAPPDRNVDPVTAGRRVVIAEDSVLLLAGLTKLLDSAGFMGAVAASFLQPLLVTVQGYHAVPGYDLASGVGTVNAALFVPELVQAAGGGYGG